MNRLVHFLNQAPVRSVVVLGAIMLTIVLSGRLLRSDSISAYVIPGAILVCLVVVCLDFAVSWMTVSRTREGWEPGNPVQKVIKRLLDRREPGLGSPASPAQQAARATTAIAAVLDDRRARRGWATAALSASLLAYVALHWITGSAMALGVVLLLMLGLAVNSASAAALEYRVNRGLYGTTEYDAREIIGVVLGHSEDLDPSGGLGDRAIAPDPETVAAIERVWAGERA